MNEKTKTILSHIGCTLGGMALGIALLGGLSYCSVREKAEQTKVNTILSKPKGEQIDTGSTGGNYTGYRFEVPSSTANFDSGAYLVRVFEVNRNTFTLTQEVNPEISYLSSNNAPQMSSAINYWTNYLTPTTDGGLRFLVIEGSFGSESSYREWVYFSFLNKTTSDQLKSFVLTNRTINRAYKVADDYSVATWTAVNSNLYVLMPSKSLIIPWSDTKGSLLNSSSPYVFQDVESYYKTLGYGDGYEQGETTGYNQGLTEGLEYGQEFTTYQVMTQDNNGGTRWPSYGWTINTNAPSGMYGDFSSSTYQIANLMQYKTQDDDLHLIYLMLPIEDNDYFGHVYIYVYNQTDSILEDTIAYGLRYYQTIADEKGWDYAYMFWTSGGTRTLDYGKVTAIYNNSLQMGYIQLSGLVYQETIYNTGYQAGLLAGQTSSNMNNVFSLFTTAFNAVGGFFELQVFGFLPLYWFFLAPLFVALIALILRMVKH